MNLQSVDFVDTAGQLPPLWDRRVTFFANLLALFFGNEAQTESLSAEVGEIDSYGARLVPILNLLFQGSPNKLVLEREPDETLCRYLEEDLQLSLPQMHVMKHREYVELGIHLKNRNQVEIDRCLASLRNSEHQWFDGYVTDETLEKISRALGGRTISSIDASRDGNNKLLLHNYLVEADLPTFDTQIISSAAQLPAAARQLQNLGYRSAVLRAQIGASGIGMLKLANLSDTSAFPAIADYFFFEGDCLLQGWLEPGIKGISRIQSPSTQLFLNEQTVYAFDMTEQILSHDSIHQGNESPPPYLHQQAGLREETMHQAAAAGRWLHRIGYRGTASIDWLVAEQTGRSQPAVYVCEINARVTGATYPSLLARHFHPEGAWLLRNLRLQTPQTAAQLLSMFERPRHLFHPDRKAGVLPLNLNFGKDNLVHKGQFLCIGETTDQCHQFLHFAETDLPIVWETDRD